MCSALIAALNNSRRSLAQHIEKPRTNFNNIDGVPQQQQQLCSTVVGSVCSWFAENIICLAELASCNLGVARSCKTSLARCVCALAVGGCLPKNNGVEGVPAKVKSKVGERTARAPTLLVHGHINISICVFVVELPSGDQTRELL